MNNQATIQATLTGILEELNLTLAYLNGACAVKRGQFSEGQIAFALKQADAWTPVEEECPKMGVSDAALRPSELQRLREPEEENGRLKRVNTIQPQKPSL